MKRSLDGGFLTAIANEPDVRPWLGGDGHLDLTGLVSDPRNYALVGESGGFVLQQLEPGRYEAHSIFRPGTREAPRMALEGFRWLFTATDCMEIVTKVPDANSRAHGLARLCGFGEIFRRAEGWNGDGCSYRKLSFDQWKARDRTLAEHGHWFHDLLSEAKTAAASELPAHPDDEAHDRAVGAAVLMLRAGNAEKAVWTYNRWAQFAGYAPIRLISTTPLLVDVIDAIVNATDVILVR